MNKQAVLNHYSSIIDNMIDNSMFFATYFQAPCYLEENIYGEDHAELPMGDNISLCGGATRVCLIDEDYDWVVKMDIDEDRYGSACEREVNIYSDAKEEHLEQYMTEAVYLGTYNRTFNFYSVWEIERYCDRYEYYSDFDEDLAGYEDSLTIVPITISIPLYGYRRASGYDCGPQNNELINAAQKIVSPLRDRNIAVASAFVREYGMEEYERFTDFIIRHRINDLHLSNIGAIKGHLVLIDFSGYHGVDDESEEW